jgi:hypothetical protein
MLDSISPARNYRTVNGAANIVSTIDRNMEFTIVISTYLEFPLHAQSYEPVRDASKLVPKR